MLFFFFFLLRLLVCLMFLLLILHLKVFKMCKWSIIYSKEKYNCLSHNVTWSLRMWIATFGLDSASLLHAKNHLSIRPAVHNQNVTIHIWSDHIVRQTILFLFVVKFSLMSYHNLFYDLKIIWQLPRHIFNLWNMFSIIKTPPLSAIHFLIIFMRGHKWPQLLVLFGNARMVSEHS